MPDMQTIDLASVDASVFRPHVNTEFTLRSVAGAFPATLIGVDEQPGAQRELDSQKRTPFSLVFHCQSALLGQGMYTLNHAELSACDIFLSPFEGGDGWCKLEAVFT